MKISLRTLVISGSVMAALSLTGTAAVVTAQATTTARTPAVSTAKHFHPFTIASPDFREDTFLPVSAEFGGPGSAGSGCGGQNLAPTLRWHNIPAGTKSFAFTMTDVDAPVADGFHHWIVYNIPRDVTTLEGHGSNPFSEGTNDFGLVGYDGPCPPPDGQVHHYIFTVYALSVTQIAGTHITFPELIAEIAPDVVGATSTIGKFRLPLGD